MLRVTAEQSEFRSKLKIRRTVSTESLSYHSSQNIVSGTTVSQELSSGASPAVITVWEDTGKFSCFLNKQNK